MSDVIAFPTKDDCDVVWVCSCGCTNHHLHASSQVECAGCGTFAAPESGDWRARLGDVPAKVEQLDHRNFKVQDLASVDVFLRRQVKAVAERRAVAAVVFFEDGSFATFNTDCDTDERRAWLRRKAEEAVARMLG